MMTAIATASAAGRVMNCGIPKKAWLPRNRLVQYMKSEWAMICRHSVRISAAIPDTRTMTSPVITASTATMRRATSTAAAGDRDRSARPKGALGMMSFFICTGTDRIATA